MSVLAVRSIPACAGPPQVVSGIDPDARVYPRVCGATSIFDDDTSTKRGLSPRVRGHPDRCMGKSLRLGSIPACAGPPSRRTSGRSRAEVYPRVCGATATTLSTRRSCRGLSPRVRGHRLNPLFRASSTGSIPACAGPPHRHGGASPSGAVYPRVCGATKARQRQQLRRWGLSPRVRGHRMLTKEECRTARSIPACAGPPWRHWRPRSEHWVYPRVCGATVTHSVPPWPILGLSPRVRGHLSLRSSRLHATGSIPACAGPP